MVATERAGRAGDPLGGMLALPGVPEALDAARAGVDALLKERILVRRRAEVRAAALARAAVATSHLEAGDAGQPVASAEALRVLSELGATAATWGRAPLQALARLHTLAAAGRLPESALGRPRDDVATAQRLVQLADVATTSTAPGLLVAAVVHGELLALAPFEQGNGLVARAAQRLVLIQRGVDPDALTVPEEGLRQLGVVRYRSAAAGFAEGTPDGLADWVAVVAASVQRGASVGREICTELAG